MSPGNAPSVRASHLKDRVWALGQLSFDGFLKPLFLGLTKLLGTTPATLFKAFPQGWSGTFRGAGYVTVTHPGAGLKRVIVRELPAELRGMAFLSGVSGSLETAFRVSPYDGRAVLEPRDPGAPQASWLVEWHARG
jgi:hypothetical protein